MTIQKNLNILITCCLLILGSTTTAHAAVWFVNSVDMGVDGGFGFSGFHYAGNNGTPSSNHDNNVMTGTAITNSTITSFINGGTYDDSTGTFNLSLILDNNSNNVDLSGTLDFNSNSSLQASFNSALTLPTTESLSSLVNIGFLPGDVCCGGTYDPNGFYVHNGIATMSIWGASWGNTATYTGAYTHPLLGMDLRLTFSPTSNANGTPHSIPNHSVPEPSTLTLMGLAVLAFRRFLTSK